MKKPLLILLCLILSLMLFSCKGNGGESEMKNKTKVISVTFINDVEEADIWILPQTEENLKTSLWGTATIPKLKAGEKTTVKLSDSADKYIVRIIDVDHAYYSADDITLSDGYSIHFKTDERKHEAVISDIDESGNVISSKEAFQGVFGAN